MRIRNKVIAHTYDTFSAQQLGAYVYYSTSGNGSGINSYTHPAFVSSSLREESRMVDSISGGKRPKACRHWVSKLERAPQPSVHMHVGARSYTGYTVYTTSAARLNCSVADSLLNPLMPSPDLGLWPRVAVTWAEQAEQQIIQSLYDKARKPVVDGLLNIVESPELPGALQAMVTDREYRTRRWTRMFDGRRSKGLRNLTGAAANKYLAYSFGIAPVIADITKVHSYLERIRRDYEKFKDHKIRRLSVLTNGSVTFDTVTNVPAEASFQGYSTFAPVTRYVLTYRDRNPYSTEFLAKLDFLLRRFGSAGPASFAWERIPFSFVVDWFIDTGSILHHLDNLLVGDPIVTVSLTKSRKCKCTIDCFRTVRRNDTNAVVQDFKVGSVHGSLYERQPLEKRTYVGFSQRFGKKQLLLTAALLRQLA